jgi:hypothetical protein
MRSAVRVWAYLAVLAMISLAACTLPAADTPGPMAGNTLAAPTIDQPHPPSEESALLWGEITPTTSADDPLMPPQYYLDVALDYTAKTLTVLQTISYTNNTGHPITNLPLVLPPSSTEGVFSLGALQIDRGFPGTQVNIDHAQIELHLDPALEPGRHVEINLDYALNLPQGSGALGYTDRQVLLADWFPIIPPYQEDAGWVIHPPGQVGEHRVYQLSHFHLNLCLEPAQEGLIIAASAPLSNQQGNCYRYSARDRRNFTLGISPYYQVSSASSALVTVHAYTFPEHTSLGLRAAELAVTAWASFSDLYGDNQRDFLSIVEADIFDGLETDGLVFLSEWYYQTADPTPQNYFELLVVHETAHQWFYALVHNDQAQEPWLDEALATYSELLFYERHHPELVGWWWDFRVMTHQPEGAVNATIYEHSQYRPYINAVYLLGAQFMQAWRDELGEAAFFEGMQRHAQSGAGKVRSAEDFKAAFFATPDVDLSHILAEFFR